MNIHSFTGNIGRDAETRTTNNGTTVTNISVGVDSGYGASKKTLWIRCALFGDRWDKVLPYLTKGKAVAISGEPDVYAWFSKDEDKARASIQVRVNDLTLLGGGDDDQNKPQRHEDGARTPEQSEKVSTTASEPIELSSAESEDDLPF